MDRMDHVTNPSSKRKRRSKKRFKTAASDNSAQRTNPDENLDAGSALPTTFSECSNQRIDYQREVNSARDYFEKVSGNAQVFTGPVYLGQDLGQRTLLTKSDDARQLLSFGFSDSQLRQVVVSRFDLEELRTLCQDLNIDFDDLRGEGKTAKVRELISYMRRQDKLEQLLSYLNHHKAT